MPSPSPGARGGQLGARGSIVEVTMAKQCRGDCAQFCAHHQTLPSVTACRSIAGKPCWTRRLSHSVTTGHIQSKVLVLRAATPFKAWVDGSSPSALTIVFNILR
jgi:hypothetical protein